MCAISWILDSNSVLNSKRLRGHRCPLDPALNFCEGNFARSGCIVCKRRKSAIVGCSERFERNQLGSFEHAIAHFLGTLYPGIDRVCDSTKKNLAQLKLA